MRKTFIKFAGLFVAALAISALLHSCFDEPPDPAKAPTEKKSDSVPGGGGNPPQ